MAPLAYSLLDYRHERSFLRLLANNDKTRLHDGMLEDGESGHRAKISS
jgi:hypothetical protein